MSSVETLRKQGFKVRVVHRRMYLTDEYNYKSMLMSNYELNEFILNNQIGPPILGPIEFGGQTIVEITTPTGTTKTGVSNCSKSENYNRKRGLNIALGRALAQVV